MIWTNGQKSLNKFLNLANDFYPSIKFPTETSSSEYIFSIPLFICKTIKSKPKFTANQLMLTSIFFPDHATPVTLLKHPVFFSTKNKKNMFN